MKIFDIKGGEWDFVHDEIINRISHLAIPCPECENIILDDEQYQCTTCGGGSEINVLNWVKSQIKLPSKNGVIRESENQSLGMTKTRKRSYEFGFFKGVKWIVETNMEGEL